MEMWVEVKKLLLSMSSSHLLLSGFCDSEDTTPNIRRLITKMKSSSSSFCVLPISEYLRINPEIAQSTILDILTKEYPEALRNALFRIYIPMYRMRSILYTLPDKDPRKRDSIILLETGEEIDYSLTIIQKNLDVELSGNEIHGFKKYLQYWEQNPNKPIILHTSNAVYFESNVFFDDVKVIVTSFELLRFHYSLPALFQPIDGTDDDWSRLAQTVAKEKTFQAACCSELSINRYNTKLFEKWKLSSYFQKWLLWMWTRLQPENSYLTDCAQNASTVEEFIELIYCRIVDFVNKPSFDDIYRQRKSLLIKLNLQTPQAFWTIVEHTTKLNALRILTDLTAKEKQTIFSLIQSYDYCKRKEVITILHEVYPALANYLQFSGEYEVFDVDENQKDYFIKYRWFKATNNLPEEFIETVKTIATDKGTAVYALKARNLVVSEEYNSDSVILFVDGMGVEYIDYLAYVFDSIPKTKYAIQYRVGFCNLPSTTQNNKDFLLGKNVLMEMLDLDEMKHGSNQYPNNIIREMAFLDTLKEIIENTMDSGKNKIILTSDHGTSRLAVLVRKTIFDRKISVQDRTIYKYGRYCEGTDITDDLPTAIEYDGKLIFADYTRFEQKGAPVDEIHGGASMEEWLVPIITIKKVSGSAKKKVTNKIILNDEELKIDPFTKMVSLEFKLSYPVTETVSVLLHGKRIVCEKRDQEYFFKYKPLDGETEVTVIVSVGIEEVGKAMFYIRRPLETNRKFDI
jgi:hypothetical protein